MFFWSVIVTIRLFFVLYCGCIFLWLEVADYDSDRSFCSYYIGLDHVCFLWMYWCLFVLVFAILLSRSDTLFCCHNKLVLWRRFLGYFANGLPYQLVVYPGLRLFIDHVICIGIRSSPRRPFIVNFPPLSAGRSCGTKNISKGLLTGLRFLIGIGSPRYGRTYTSDWLRYAQAHEPLLMSVHLDLGWTAILAGSTGGTKNV